MSKNSADIRRMAHEECSTHLVGTFPHLQHVQPVESVQHAAVATRARSVPIALHEHYYTNSSNSTDGYYHRAWLRTFEFYLQNDFREALKPGSLSCAIPNDGRIFDKKFGECPTSYTNPKVFGGTRVEYDGAMIRYTFGTEQGPQNGYKPILPGINPEIDKGIFFSDDTTQAETRTFRIGLDFETTDLERPMWSATTTSRAEVLHTAIPKKAFDKSPEGLPDTEGNKGKFHSCIDGVPWTADNSWCPIGDYQWIAIGTVVSIWETVK
jgi:hypothetical protein